MSDKSNPSQNGKTDATMLAVGTEPSSSSGHILEVDFKRLVENLPEGVLLHRDGEILYANPETCHIFGVAPGEQASGDVVGKPLLSFFQPEAWKRVQQSVQAMEEGSEGSEGSEDVAQELHGGIPAEVQLIRADDKEATLETITTMVSVQGVPTLCTLIKDISQRKQGEARIRHQANYDELTGLPNRTLFMDRLQREIVRARRLQHQRKHGHDRKASGEKKPTGLQADGAGAGGEDPGGRVALMFIDLDRFKWVNDTLGHAAGDELLREVSMRLQQCLRKSDTVARMGGDEFTAILPDMARGPFAERVASEVLAQLVAPFNLSGQEALISGSIGIAIYPDDANSLDELLRNADTAMYRAKSAGRNGYRFFTPDMHAEALERMELENDLHHALGREELVIHYQPIVNLETRRVLGAESLLRWIHPKRGNISPAIFIPMAEEIGLIGKITEWTIRTVCAQAQTWRQRAGNENFFVSVNLSCNRCRELSTDEAIQAIFRDTGLSPTALVLEITENILAEDADRAMLMLKNLVSMGVNLWLDDFGTGSSSLSVLKRLPVSAIKIDRAFVPDASSDPETIVLVEAILSLARSLDRKVIGEGIESEEQATFLSDRKCRMGQGYLFLKPEAAEKFERILGKTFKTQP